MKKSWILLVVIALLLTGCGHQDRHPEWNEDWLRFGDLLAAEAPEGFYLGEYNDTLSLGGIWYAAFNCGREPKPYVNAEGEDAEVYDAQIFLLVEECESEAAARAELAGWIEREAQSYETDGAAERRIGDQSYQAMTLKAAKADNPYSHGAAAFAARGNLAISAELLCSEDFAGEAQTILEQFLSGIHYGEQEA